jgi:hypothetical protein
MDTHHIPRICPECAQGKHRNCDGTSWNEVLDSPDTCECELAECSAGYPGPR